MTKKLRVTTQVGSKKVVGVWKGKTFYARRNAYTKNAPLKSISRLGKRWYAVKKTSTTKRPFCRTRKVHTRKIRKSNSFW